MRNIVHTNKQVRTPGFKHKISSQNKHCYKKVKISGFRSQQPLLAQAAPETEQQQKCRSGAWVGHICLHL